MILAYLDALVAKNVALGYLYLKRATIIFITINIYITAIVFFQKHVNFTFL